MQTVNEYGKCGTTGVVIVGAGLIARFHANAVKASSKLHLVACVDNDFDRAKRFAEEHNCEVSIDLDATLARPDVGMVTVATPSGTHDDAVLAAARHHKPVLVEKPMSITPERIDTLISACRDADTPLGCIFQTRWGEDFRKIKETVESGGLGRITFVRVDVPWWRDDSYYAGTWHGTWKLDGGGALINQAIHMIDWLVALMPPVADIKAFCGTLTHPMEAEDTAVAILKFKGGALGSIYATTASRPGGGKRLEIHGTKGTYIWEDQATGVSRPDQLEHEDHRRCFEAFADSLCGGAPYPVDGREARKAVELIDRIYKESGLR